MKRTLSILVGLSVFTIASHAEKPSNLFGRFLNVKGIVEMLEKGAKKRVSVKRGDLIHYGAKVWTRANSRATIITADKKIVNLVPNSELDTGGTEPNGKLVRSLGMEGLFQEPSPTYTLSAVAGVRAELEYILSPRYSAIKTTTPVIHFRPLRKNERYRVKITGGDLPSPYKGVIDTTVLDLSKAHLRKPLERGCTYFIQAEKVDKRGGLRGKERDVFIHPISTGNFQRISAIEKEIAQLQKEDPDNPSYSILLASQYEEMGLYSDALAIYESLYKTQPKDVFIRSQLAHMYNQVKLITELRKLGQPEK